MLWYKSLREIRSVTLVGIAAMAIACAFIVFYQQTMRDHADAPMTYIAYIWKAVYNSVGRDIFVILSIILGSGGLLQERAHGTSGYCGVLAIAAVPIAVLPIASRYAGQYYPVAQTLGFAALWATGGAVFYGFTFLLSHHLEGEYTSVLLAVPSLMLYGVILQFPWLAHLRMLNIFDIINGEDMPFFNQAQHLLIAPLPWLTLAVMLIVSFAFVHFAARRMQPRDF
jgi:hypothetical protein